MEENKTNLPPFDSKELREYMKTSYRDRMIQVLEMALNVSFPGIENLEIEYKEDGSDLVTISFSEGIYSREEVIDKLNELRNFKNPI